MFFQKVLYTVIFFFCVWYRCSRHKILDIAFYDAETLSVLLQEDNEDCLPVLVQVSLSSILSEENCLQKEELSDIPLIHQKHV